MKTKAELVLQYSSNFPTYFLIFCLLILSIFYLFHPSDKYSSSSHTEICWFMNIVVYSLVFCDKHLFSYNLNFKYVIRVSQASSRILRKLSSEILVHFWLKINCQLWQEGRGSLFINCWHRGICSISIPIRKIAACILCVYIWNSEELRLEIGIFIFCQTSRRLP